MILVDANVLIDVLEPASRWYDWSFARLREASDHGAFTNYVVAAEVGSRFESGNALQQLFAALALPVRDMDFDSAHQAGLAYTRWIRNGGRRGVILADLLIGAQASSLEAAILTRDTRRFRIYFPDLHLITPETDQA